MGDRERTGKFVVTTATNLVEGINIAKEKRSNEQLITAINRVLREKERYGI